VFTSVTHGKSAEAGLSAIPGYKAAVWCTVGFAGIGLSLATFGMKSRMLVIGGDGR
jgi:hypothetical protein